MNNGGTNNNTPDAPIVDAYDCSMLPQAIEGEDPLLQLEYVYLQSDLTCPDTGGFPDTGAALEMEYYIDEDSRSMNFRVFKADSDPWHAVSTDATGAEEALDGNQDLFGWTGMPEGEDITVTIANDDESRTVEVVFQIAPPYFIVKSITEL